MGKRLLSVPITQLICSILTFLPPGVILISFDLSVVLNLEAVFKNFHFMMKTAKPDVEKQ